MRDQMEWGIFSIGVAGRFHIELNEGNSPAGLTVWWVSFEFHPHHQLWFEVENPQIFVEALRFFEDTYQKEAQGYIELGQCFGSPLVIEKDDEFNDRYFMIIKGTDDMSYWQICLAGGEANDFICALRQVVEDLAA